MTTQFKLNDDEKRELIETRRDLHMHPETAFEEERTAGIVIERLKSLGLSPVTGIAKTGVTALLEGEEPGPCVLIRADMDALPIFEESEEEYKSVVDGNMHACGHDGHTSVALSAARQLLKIKRPKRGSIKFLFQPAEEVGDGAKAMIEEGVLENPKVDAAFGLHLWNYMPTGVVGVTPGPVMAAADLFTVDIFGEGCHGAQPHMGRDPVLAAAHVITSVQQIASRIVNPLTPVVVTVSQIHGGDAYNVIPDSVTIAGTIRTFDDEVWEGIPGLFQEIVERTAHAFDCTVEIDYKRATRPVENDPEMTALVREIAVELVGEDNIVEEQTTGAEDFAEFLHHVPGCFFFVGSANHEEGKDHPHHSPRFDFDEGSLPLAVEMLAEVAHRYLEKYGSKTASRA